MKNKKGFTLIELLAIIVIIAIIAVVTTPIILNVIENSRRGASTDSAYGFKDAVQKYYLSNIAAGEDTKVMDGVYTVTDGVLDGLNVEIPAAGNVPSSGSMTYNKNILVTACLVFPDHTVTYQDGAFAVSETDGCE
jgi:type IV pilus assembly protein PilA